MGYNCKICNVNPVQNLGDVCQTCSDPYSSVYNAPPSHASPQSTVSNSSNSKRRNVLINTGVSNTGNSLPNSPTPIQTSPSTGGNQITNQSSAIPAAPLTNSYGGSSSANSSAKTASTPGVDDYEVEGNVRNYKEETSKSFFIERWLRTLFSGVPFSIDNTIHTFQVYQGWASTNTNSQICDEVVIYGQITRGKISQDNTVQVWGKRDKTNAIVATKVHNVSSNTWLGIRYGLSPVFAWVITLALIALPFLGFTFLKNNPEVWGILFGVILMLIAVFNFRLFLRIAGMAITACLAVVSGIFKLMFGIFFRR